LREDWATGREGWGGDRGGGRGGLRGPVSRDEGVRGDRGAVSSRRTKEIGDDPLPQGPPSLTAAPWRGLRGRGKGGKGRRVIAREERGGRALADPPGGSPGGRQR